MDPNNPCYKLREYQQNISLLPFPPIEPNFEAGMPMSRVQALMHPFPRFTFPVYKKMTD